MKLSEFKDEAALDVLAEIIEPAAEILADTEVKRLFSESKPKCISYSIKAHKASVIAILAALDGVHPEDFHCNVFTLPAKLLEMLNDEELVSLFT